MKQKLWKDNQINRLRVLYKTYSARVCAEMMGEKVNVVKDILARNGLTGRGHLKFWTADKNQKLIERYSETKNADLASMFGVSENAINAQAFKLKIFKSSDFKRRHTEAGMFKPGLVPHNKGAKMPKAIYEKVKATMFKPGIVPANSKKEGDISVRPDKKGTDYRFIRIDKKWIPYARHIYQTYIGEIPTGYIVKHKDGNTMNDSPENLYSISRKENAKENHNRQKAGVTMKKMYDEGKINNPMINMTDKTVASWIAPRNISLQAKLLEYPELIELKRNQLKLKRQCKAK